MQIELEKQMHVVFTGSDVLLSIIKQVPETEFPFQTTIMKNGEHFEFT